MKDLPWWRHVKVPDRWENGFLSLKSLNVRSSISTTFQPTRDVNQYEIRLIYMLRWPRDLRLARSLFHRVAICVETNTIPLSNKGTILLNKHELCNMHCNSQCPARNQEKDCSSAIFQAIKHQIFNLRGSYGLPFHLWKFEDKIHKKMVYLYSPNIHTMKQKTTTTKCVFFKLFTEIGIWMKRLKAANLCTRFRWKREM